MFLTHERFAFNPNPTWFAISNAAWEGHATCTHLLVTLGSKKENFNINAIAGFGYSALLRAADSGFEHILDDLLSHPDIDVNITVPNWARNFCGNTPLLFSVDNSHTECTRLLLGHPKINPNFPENVSLHLLLTI